MKLTKTLGVIAFLTFLTACSEANEDTKQKTATEPAKTETIPAVETKADTTKSEIVKVYLCQNVVDQKTPQTISVGYIFEGDKAVSADISVVKKALPEVLKRTDYIDSAQFESQNYLLNVEPPLTPETVDKVTVMQLLKKGKDADEILAKNCEVH